ncbi:alpha-L-fucosidase [Streptomyces radicis]|uniref:alpha-L-fucosidase n=1 Tax=Streptomyces radicis TaxID=1750517 RepID=A0A3A9VUQ2_9ACTN|nr:alpha-L-fucosidase [Streptomyces radicis]RKN04735.1 alpha-L-fucosidase [Streptomyces radicis]RKN15941.1 alpha-L-fucosidase [Streptomyces radicis]
MSRRTALAALTGAVAATGLAQETATAADEGVNVVDHPIRPAPVMPVEPGDSPARIVEKAAHIVPRPAQVAWQRREIIAFGHFGMNTFTDREWGSGMEEESRFNPSRVDVAQWMRAYRAMGAELIIFTAKHHDGFTLYPTRYTCHSVIASPWWIAGAGEGAERARAEAEARRGDDPSAYWRVRDAGGRNPEGDVLGSVVRAAREAGLRVGVYLSPSDGAELPHAWHAETYVPWVRARPESERSSAERATLEDAPAPPAGHGRFGNGSVARARTIPTLVAGDDRADAVRAGRLPSFEVAVDDYDAYYLNQVYELFTEYGPIDELWLDGANPWAASGISQPYDFTTWFRVIEALSPDTVVFAGPQGTRWVGNEDGVARATEWSVVPATADPDTAHNEGLIPGGAQAEDIGSRDVLTGPGVRYLQWFPAEADFSLRPGWFFHPDESPKTPAQLVERYLSSVGRNAVMLLNVPPAPDGRIAPQDVDSLAAFHAAVRATYGVNLLSIGRRDPVIAALTDPDLSTGWSPRGGAATGDVELTLPREVTFDQVRLGEDITRGQRVEEFVVEAWDGANWAVAAAGSTIGYSRILVMPEPLTARRLRIRLTRTRARPRLAFAGLYRTVSPA